MTSPFPPANLPPQSRAWKKAVEGGLKSITRSISALSARVTNSISGVNAALKYIRQNIAQLQEQQTHLRNLFDSGYETNSGFSWQDSTPVTISTTVNVPAGARLVNVIAIAEAVFCCNSSAGVAAAFTQLTMDCPDLAYTGDAGPNVYVQSNQQAQRSRSFTFSDYDVSDISSLTFTVRGYSTNTGTNVDNYIKVQAFCAFSF